MGRSSPFRILKARPELPLERYVFPVDRIEFGELMGYCDWLERLIPWRRGSNRVCGGSK